MVACIVHCRWTMSNWGVVLDLFLFFTSFPLSVQSPPRTLPRPSKNWQCACELPSSQAVCLLICIAFITPRTEMGHLAETWFAFSIVSCSWLQGACPCWWRSSTQSAMSPCLPLSSSNVTTPPRPSFRMWSWHGASSPSARTPSLTTTLHVSVFPILGLPESLCEILPLGCRIYLGSQILINEKKPQRLLNPIPSFYR